MNFISLFSTLDLFILFLYIAAVLLHLIFIRKSKLFVNILALYVSFALLVIVPLFNATVSGWLASHPYARVAAIAGLYIVLSFLLTHSNLGEFSQKVSPTQFSTSLIERIAIVGLLFTSVMYFLPANVKQQFGVVVNALFTNLIAMLVWFVLPLLIAFAYRFKTRRGWIE